MNTYDVIVIGAGIGGLTSAFLSAKKGLRVAVFEKEPRPGGYCTSFFAGGYVFDACIDSIGGLGKNEPLGQLIDEVCSFEKSVRFIPLSPVRRNIFPDMCVDIPAGIPAYKDLLTNFFPAEKQGIDKSFSVMSKMYDMSVQSIVDTAQSDVLPDFIGVSWYDFISSFISDAKLKAVLSSYCTFLGLPAYEVSAIAAANILMHYVKGGAFRVQGGMGHLIEAFTCGIAHYGGELFLGQEVNRIRDDGGYSTITTNSGVQARGKHIISNMDIKTALQCLQCRNGNEKKIQKIQSLDVSGSFMIMYLGVCDDLSTYDLKSSIGYFSSYDFNGMLNENEYFSFGLGFPSLIDPSLAPGGGASIVIHWPFCYNNAPVAGYKNVFGKKIIEKLSVLVPGIEKKIVYQSVAGPWTLQRYTGNTHGSAYGWKQSSDFFKNLLFFRDIAERFHIVGHWAGYGGGVMPSMLSAYKVVHDILKQEV